MSDVEMKTSFRFTVSGGLESMAEREARQLLGDGLELRWARRGKAGSQMEINCSTSKLIETSMIVMRMRFVDYVYLEILQSKEFNVTQQTFHSMIQNVVSSEWNHERSSDFVSAARRCQKYLSEKHVGLEKLPGALLKTPELGKMKDTLDDHPTTNRQFEVNTIYTKPAVARSITNTFVSLIRKCSPEYFPGRIQWLDAGAGSGSLLNHLPSPRIGVDTHPNHPEIIPFDFFQITKEWLDDHQQNKTFERKLCVISNPPFSEGSRGDYTAIVKFVNHAATLNASYLGLLVPAKFARERIWKSLGMDSRYHLLARFFLPHEAFFDPSSKKSVHVHSYFLFFRLSNCSIQKFSQHALKNNKDISLGSFHVVGKRDKSYYPWMNTADLTNAVVMGLESAGVVLASESSSEFSLLSKISRSNEKASILELMLLLNPERPLSLANCFSRRVLKHSLGWISSSAKPPIAYAMCNLTMFSEEKKDCSVIINAMSGEGTIELESQSLLRTNNFFVISGDKNESAAMQTTARLKELGFPLVDLVVWDAQRLPLRSDIADAFLADLPFAGSTKKIHQEPGGTKPDASLDYRRVFVQAARVLRSSGKAAFVSADTQALRHATRGLHLTELTKISGMNLGGLSGTLSVIKKGEPCFKDLSLWVAPDTRDLSQTLMKAANGACAVFDRDEKLELRRRNEQERSRACPSARTSSFIVSVELKDTFFHPKKRSLSQCYRFWFDGLISNNQAKLLEQTFRFAIEKELPKGVDSLR